MSFFAAIIRDSRATATVTPANREKCAGPTQEPAASKPTPLVKKKDRAAPLPDINQPTVRLREESATLSQAAEQDQGSIEKVARQVVSPSPAQHIPLWELGQVRAEWAGSPNPETREQTGSASDTKVTDAPRTTPTKSRHGDGSFDVSAVQESANDSSIREPSPNSAASRAGIRAVETQGRQQAEQSRAGLTTPPEQTIEQTKKQGFTLSIAQPTRPCTRESPPLSPPKQHAPGLHGAIEHVEVPPPRISSAPDQIPVLKNDRRSSAEPSFEPAGQDHQPADRSAHKTETRTGEAEPSRPPVVARETLSVQHQKREKSAGMLMQRAPEPRVQIGTIEVVVISEEPPEPRPRRETQRPSDATSRHYLRNL